MPRKARPCSTPGCPNVQKNSKDGGRCLGCYQAAHSHREPQLPQSHTIAEVAEPIRIEVAPAFRPASKASLPTRAPRILVIPDTQIKPGVPIEHLAWAGRYAAAKRPDAIVLIGDWWDMASFSSYDRGKLQFEGRRYRLDIEAGLRGLEAFMSPIRQAPGYNPYIPFTEGNHERRVTRAVEENPVLEGLIGPHDFKLEDFGIEYHPFLEVVTINDIEFSHYFTSGPMQRPVSSAASLLRSRMKSAVMGHNQATDIAFHQKTRHIGVFCGTFYQHDEEYLGFQGNNQRRQVLMLNEVRDGTFDPMFLSLEYLKRRFS